MAVNSCNEVLFVPCHPTTTDRRSRETMNDDAAMNNPAPVKYSMTFGAMGIDLRCGEYEVQCGAMRRSMDSGAKFSAAYGVYNDQ